MNQMDTMKLRESLLDENQWQVKSATLDEVHLAHLSIPTARVVATIDHKGEATYKVAAPLHIILKAMLTYDGAFEGKFRHFISHFAVTSLVHAADSYVLTKER